MEDKEQRIIVKITKKPKKFPCFSCPYNAVSGKCDTCKKLKDFKVKTISIEIDEFEVLNRIAVALINAGIKETPIFYATVAYNSIFKEVENLWKN